MNIFELFGTIAIDHSEADRSLDKVTGNAKDAESKLEKTFKRIGSFAAAAFSVTAIVNFGKTCTQVYADVAAEQAAFEQVMGDYASTAQAKLDAVANQTGITATRMTGAFNSLTAKFKGLGYDTEDATTLAADGLMIAADASAFWNVSMDEAMAHLNSFINGSYEGGEAIGLFANDTQMAAYAVEKGIVADAKAWASLDEATKQATRLDYARTMQQNSGVTGQAAKEADAYQNVLGNLTEAWKQFQAIIGKPILERIVLPAMRKLNEIMPGINEAVQKGIDWLTAGFDKIAAYFSEVFTEDGLDMKAFPSALKNMFRDAARSIPALLSSVGRAIRTAWVNTVWPAVQGAIKVAFGVDLPEWSKIESDVIKWWGGLDDGIAAKIAGVCNWTLSLFGKPADVTEEQVSTVLDSWWTNTKETVSTFCAWTLMLFGAPVEDVDAVKGKVDEWWTGVRSGAESALEWVLSLFGVPQAGVEGVKNLVSGWWQGVKTAAQNALDWTLKLFKNPTETAGEVATHISTWWATVVSSAQSVLNWWLKLFDNPREAGSDVYKLVKDWWDGVKTDAESALEWALKLFGVPLAEGNGVKNLVSGWWQGVKTAAQDALIWTLKLFGMPEETAGQVATNISTWWATVVSSAQSALNWVLKLFDDPVAAGKDVYDLVSGWWEGVKADAESALVWVLKLFGVPLAGGEGVKNLVSGWWSGVKANAQDALIWTLKLFGMPEEKAGAIATKISAWWAGIVGGVQGACNWVLNLFAPPKDGADGTTPASIISDWWSGVVADVQNACIWFLNLFNPPKDGEEGAETPASVIGKWWNGVVRSVQDACKWVLNLFEPPDEGAAQTTLIDWWDAIWARLRDVLTIDLSWLDLSGLDITHVFVAGKNAIQGVVNAAKTFYTEVLNSLETDEEGKLELEATLSNLFDAGVTAAKNLLSVAGNLVGEIVTAVTGDEEAGEKIGAVFGELFSWASEIVIGVKDGAITAFQWLLDNETNVTRVLGAITGLIIGLAIANPAIAVIEAISGLIILMTTDWANFEKNYPQLTETFEKLTGLDFTDVANSLNGFKTTMTEVFEFFAENENAINAILVAAGALSVLSGNLPLGLALVGAGGYSSILNVREDENQEDMRRMEATSERLANADGVGDYVDALVDYATGDVRDPLDMSYILRGEDDPNAYGDSGRNSSAYAMETKGLMDGWRGVREEMEAVWDEYRAHKNDGTPIDSESTLKLAYAMLDHIRPYGMKEDVNDRIVTNAMKALYNHMLTLSTDMENLPDEMFFSPSAPPIPDRNRRVYDDGSTGGNGMGGMHPETFTTFVDDAYDPWGFSSKLKNFTPTNNALSIIQAALAQNNEAQKASVMEGIIAGFSGATVQVDVSAGNITLQDNTIVGRWMPKINAALGAAAARSQRTKG